MPMYTVYSKDELNKRWLTNYKLFYHLYYSIQKYFSTILDIPVNKIFNAGYQEFFVKYFFNIDKYRQFLEKVNQPFVIYNIPSIEIDRTKLNKIWNDDGLFEFELENHLLYIQKSYMRQTLNFSLYCNSREQLISYLQYFMGTFDQPNGTMTVWYNLDEFVPVNESYRNLTLVDYITIINPDSFEDGSEYLFEDRTYRLNTTFVLEGYVLTKLRFYPKSETISQFRIFSGNFNNVERIQTNSVKLVKVSLEYDDPSFSLDLNKYVETLGDNYELYDVGLKIGDTRLNRQNLLDGTTVVDEIKLSDYVIDGSRIDLNRLREKFIEFEIEVNGEFIDIQDKDYIDIDDLTSTYLWLYNLVTGIKEKFDFNSTIQNTINIKLEDETLTIQSKYKEKIDVILNITTKGIIFVIDEKNYTDVPVDEYQIKIIIKRGKLKIVELKGG